MSFLFPKSSSLPHILPSPNRGGQALDEVPRAQRPATRLRSGRGPTLLTDPRVAPGVDGGTESQEDAQLTQDLAPRLRGARVPTILTGARLAGREPASAAGRPVATAGAPRDEARPETGDVAFLHRQQQIRPKAQGEIEAFKRNPNPEKPHIFHMEESRRSAILNNWPNIRFNIRDNPQELGEAPCYRDEDIGKDAVKKHDEIIEREARAQGVEPNLVRAIMYIENADGNPANLNRRLEKFGLAQSILPMNIKPRFWAGLVGVKEEEFRKPEVNIRAAVTLIKRIQERLHDNDRTPAKIGSIYNFTGREKVSDIGARIQKAYNDKPWEK